jgi:hypothetical protein
MIITLDLVKNTIKRLGYKWYNDRPNLVGVRTTLDVPDAFNDFFIISTAIPAMPNGLTLIKQQAWLNKWGFKGENGKTLVEDGDPGNNTNYALAQYNANRGKEIIKVFPTTTNPGVYWLNFPISKLGTAILKPNQWIDCWSLGFHQGKPDHKALVQTGKVTVYRDANRDQNYQLNDLKTETGLFGINIHGSGKLAPSKQIGKWSAGCQVFSNWAHKEEVMGILEKFRTVTRNKFTYSLINEADLA